MGKLDERVDELHAIMKDKMGIKSVDKDLLRAVAKNLGPNLYNSDASKVAFTDPEELETIKNNLLKKKFGMKDESAMEKAMKNVTSKFDASDRNKQRAVLYYLLAKECKKESVYM